MFTLFKSLVSATLLVFVSEQCLSQPPGVQWNKTYGGSYPDDCSVTIQTSDGGYLSAGSSRSPQSGVKSQSNFDNTFVTYDFWLVKSDPLGTMQWDIQFGGTSQDVCTALLQTADNGFIVAGYSCSDVSGNKNSPFVYACDYWLMKLDAFGNKLWEHVYGGNGNDYLTSVVQNSSGGFTMAGFTTSGISGSKTDSSRGANDYWIVCTDAWGNKLWDKTFGGSQNDYARCIRQTIDGGYIIGGSSQSDISGDKTENNHGASYTSDYWVVKIDEVGNKMWDKRFGTADDDLLYTLVQLNDGSYLLGGHSTGGVSYEKSVGNRGGYDYWIIKVNSSGAKLWDKRFGGSGIDYLYSLQQTIDGGFILGGTSDSPLGGDKVDASRGQEDYWIVKITAAGVKEWDKTVGGSNEDWLASVRQTTDGGYILGGRSLSSVSGEKSEASYGNFDFWIVKLGANPLPVQLVEFFGSQSKDQKIKLTWTTASEINNSNFTLEKFIDGNFTSIVDQPGHGNSTVLLHYEAVDESPVEGDNVYRLRQTDYDGHSETFGPVVIYFKTDSRNILTAYPNPATEHLNVLWKPISEEGTIRLSDYTGKCQYQQILSKDQEKMQIPLTQIAPGYYLLTLETSSEILQQKIEIR